MPESDERIDENLMDLSEFLAKKDKTELGVKFDFDEQKPKEHNKKRSSEPTSKKSRKLNGDLNKKKDKKDKLAAKNLVKFDLMKNEQKNHKIDDVHRCESEGSPFISPVGRDSIDDRVIDNNNELLKKKDDGADLKESRFRGFWASILRCTCCKRRKKSPPVIENRILKGESKGANANTLPAPGSILKNKKEDNNQRSTGGRVSISKEMIHGHKGMLYKRFFYYFKEKLNQSFIKKNHRARISSLIH